MYNLYSFGEWNFLKPIAHAESSAEVKDGVAGRAESSLSSRGMQVVWRDWCVLRYFSATDVRIERSERRSTDGHDHAEGHNRHIGHLGELRFGDRARSNGGHDPATAGKLAAPCGPQARAQRGPGPPLLPGKVRSHGSDRWDISIFFPLCFTNVSLSLSFLIRKCRYHVFALAIFQHADCPQYSLWRPTIFWRDRGMIRTLKVVTLKIQRGARWNYSKYEAVIGGRNLSASINPVEGKTHFYVICIDDVI